jgi:hypothetical protein
MRQACYTSIPLLAHCIGQKKKKKLEHIFVFFRTVTLSWGFRDLLAEYQSICIEIKNHKKKSPCTHTPTNPDGIHNPLFIYVKHPNDRCCSNCLRSYSLFRSDIQTIKKKQNENPIHGAEKRGATKKKSRHVDARKADGEKKKTYLSYDGNVRGKSSRVCT